MHGDAEESGSVIAHRPDTDLTMSCAAAIDGLFPEAGKPRLAETFYPEEKDRMTDEARTTEKQIPTLDELETILNTGGEVPIQILPNGELAIKGKPAPDSEPRDRGLAEPASIGGVEIRTAKKQQGWARDVVSSNRLDRFTMAALTGLLAYSQQDEGTLGFKDAAEAAIALARETIRQLDETEAQPSPEFLAAASADGGEDA